MSGRENGNMISRTNHFTRQSIDFGNPINFITEKFNADGVIITTGWENFHHISPYPKTTALKINIVTIKLNIY